MAQCEECLGIDTVTSPSQGPVSRVTLGGAVEDLLQFRERTGQVSDVQETHALTDRHWECTFPQLIPKTSTGLSSQVE